MRSKLNFYTEARGHNRQPAYIWAHTIIIPTTLCYKHATCCPFLQDNPSWSLQLKKDVSSEYTKHTEPTKLEPVTSTCMHAKASQVWQMTQRAPRGQPGRPSILINHDCRKFKLLPHFLRSSCTSCMLTRTPLATHVCTLVWEKTRNRSLYTISKVILQKITI